MCSLLLALLLHVLHRILEVQGHLICVEDQPSAGKMQGWNASMQLVRSPPQSAGSPRLLGMLVCVYLYLQDDITSNWHSRRRTESPLLPLLSFFHTRRSNVLQHFGILIAPER